MKTLGSVNFGSNSKLIRNTCKSGQYPSKMDPKVKLNYFSFVEYFSFIRLEMLKAAIINLAKKKKSSYNQE